MSTRVNAGVFGVGSLGQWHARIYSELEAVNLVGVYDINRERAEEIAARYGTQPYTEIEALAERIDAASVVVPTDKHLEVFQKLATFDLSMLMEKPIASTTEQARHMVSLARERNLILQVGHVERFNPVMKFLEENLTRPRFVEATRLAAYPPPRAEGPPRGTEVSVVLDLMIHDLEIILHLMNSGVTSVHAVGVPVLSPSEDIANVRLGFANGGIANVTASRISREPIRKIRVFQENTYLSLDYMGQTGQLCTKTSGGIDVREVPLDRDEPLAAELKSFVDCVQHHRDPLVSGEHASEALRLAVDICDQIRNHPS